MKDMCLRQGGQSLTVSPGIIALLALVGGVRAAPFVLCWRPCSELSLQIYLSSTRPSHGPLLLPFNAPSPDLTSPQASVPFTGMSAMSGAGCRWEKKERIELWTPPKWILLLATGSRNLLLFGGFLCQQGPLSHRSQHAWPCHLDFSRAYRGLTYI